MFNAQNAFHSMLEDIHSDPRGFSNYVGERRDDMVSESKTSLHSEVDLQTSSLKNYEVYEPVGKGRFSTVYRCKRKGEGTKEMALKKVEVVVKGSDKR